MDQYGGGRKDRRQLKKSEGVTRVDTNVLKNVALEENCIYNSTLDVIYE